jgi:glutamate formiminotransferase
MVAGIALTMLDLREHEGVHPRLGCVDVVPFVSLRRDADGNLSDGPIEEAILARTQFITWAAELGVPCFSYGPERSLPDVRRDAFGTLEPDTGPKEPHPTGGSCAVGARPLLVAYNLWLSSDARDDCGPPGSEGADTPQGRLQLARSIARAVRGPTVRALGFPIGSDAQVSINLIDPFHTGPAQAYDSVAQLAEKSGTGIERAELVGLVPARVLADTPDHRLAELGLDEEHTIEARLEARTD